jgi:predicted nucleic acid-binding protein
MARKRIKIFLDSNVVLSGLLSEKGSPRIILDVLHLDLPFVTGATGEYNLLEIERNLKKKMPGILQVYREWFPKLRLEIVPLPFSLELKPYAGLVAEKDLPVLASAAIWDADLLITGDKKDFKKAKQLSTLPLRIVSPSEFVQELGEFFRRATA